MSYETIRWEVADGVGTLTLNRPDALNAINAQLAREVQDALRSAERDRSVRCVVLTGAGRGFCAGADLRERQENQAEVDAATARGERGQWLRFGQALRERYNPIVLRLRTLEKPVIAAVNGVAAGAGCSFALACDLRIASDQASFIQAFVRIGLVPDSGATYLLPRLVGWGRALELVMTGERVGAEEALRIGLVNRVVPHAEFEAAWRATAAEFAQAPTRAIGLTKRLFNRSLVSDLEEQLNWEAFLQEVAGGTADAREGRAAFLEKRTPNFRGE